MNKKEQKELEKLKNDYKLANNAFRIDVLESESLLVAKALAELNQEILLFQWFNNLIHISVLIETIQEF